MTKLVMLNQGLPNRQAPADAPSVKHEDMAAWVKNHLVQIDQYNEWAEQRETYSQPVRRWRASTEQVGKAD